MGTRRRICILDHQIEFINRLARYMESKSDFPFDVVTFTESDEFTNYEEQNNVDLLLCEEAIASAYASEFKVKTICLLTEYYYVNEASRYPTIFKYQSAEEIINEIMRISYPPEKDTELSSEGPAHVIGVCSPSGGSCKSTFALALALKHSIREKTLFLSFDPFYNIPGTQKEERGQNLSDIIYYLKQNQASIHLKIKAVTKRKGKLDYILGVAHWVDLIELTPAELRELIDEIIQRMSYDVIIIDMGNFGTTSMEMLTYCETIYVPNLCDGRLEREKEKEWKRQLRFIGGEKLLNRINEVIVPLDENLSGDRYSLETIENGVVGNLIDTIFSKGEYAYG